jgi:transcriptional regulatory protein RtcR
MERKRQVVLGVYGPKLDQGKGPKRWESWRPTVALCMQDDLVVDRFELLHGLRDTAMAELIAGDIAQVSPETTVRRHVLPLTDAWDFEQVFGALHDFARAYPFDLEAENYLVHITTGTHVMQICFFLLTESRHFPAALVQTSPPTAQTGPAGQHSVIALDLSRYDRLARRFAVEQAEGQAFLKSGIDTRDAAFNRLIEQIERVAVRSRAPMLLMGPTGAGKSRLAQQIYALKKARRQVVGPLVEVNCATLRGDGAQSALFGHVRGAYTGAQTARDGLLRRADGGLLFLDEIGELGLDEQAMLLRAIEHRRFLPVGADAEVESDFQLIAGTNRDLRAAVRAGQFREDLLARLDLWTFRLPGLAERRADIEPNFDYELRRASDLLGQHTTINREARRRFLAFAATAPWPANFRELGAAVLRMATLAPAHRIDEATVVEEIARLEAAWVEPGEDDGLGRLMGEKVNEIDAFDRVQLAYVVRVCRQSTSLAEAGRTLFSASRAQRTSTNDGDRLRKYLAKFSLSFADLGG